MTMSADHPDTANKRSISFAKPYFPAAMQAVILEDMSRVLQSGQLIDGEYSWKFERQLAGYVSRAHVVSVSSCTTALQICLQSLDLAGDEVLVPAAGFTTDISAVKWAGGTPVLVDVDPKTLTFDLEDLERKISPRSRALIWVHLAGVIAPSWREIVRFARERTLFLIEDCAHALGASIDGRRAGTFGDTACFSFYPTKIISSGTGGAIATDADTLADFAREMRTFGRERGTGRVVREGNDWWLDEFRSVVACHQMDALDEILARRRHLAHRYDLAFEGISEIDRVMKDAGEPSYYHYVILLPSNASAKRLSLLLKERFDIPSRPIYPALQEELVFRDLDDGTLSVAADTLARSVCLPMHPGLADDDVDWIAACTVAALR